MCLPIAHLKAGNVHLLSHECSVKSLTDDLRLLSVAFELLEFSDEMGFFSRSFRDFKRAGCRYV